MDGIIALFVIVSIVTAVNKSWKRILRWWHRKKFCEDNRGLCRALITAGFPDFKEYLYFKEDFSDRDKYQSWYEHGCIKFYRSEMSSQDKEKILKVVEDYYHCYEDRDRESSITRIYLQGKKRGK